MGTHARAYHPPTSSFSALMNLACEPSNLIKQGGISVDMLCKLLCQFRNV